MDRLNIIDKREGDDLSAPEWNSSVSKINEIVDALNGSATVQRKIYMQNNLDSKNLASQNGEPCMLDFTFISQERYSYDAPYENTGERGLCSISVKNAEYKEFQEVRKMMIPSASAQRIDVSEFLTSGVNQILIKATGEITGETTPAYVYNVQLTSLAVSAPNFRWWVAVQSSIVVPFLIAGNISKKLFINLKGKDTEFDETYTVNLGNATYTETAYNYAVPHPQMEGTYVLKAWLTNADETLQTQPVSYEVMCAMPANQRKLIAVNNKALTAINWTENVLFDYAVYDGQATHTGATFTVIKDGSPVFQSVEDTIPTNTRNSFSFPMEITTDDDSNFEIRVSITDDQGELTDQIPFEVENSYGYSAISGASFFMNPKTRSNNQANKMKILNEVDETEINTNWSGMNWGSDGWQTDSDNIKVLRILAGSTSTIELKPFAEESARRGKTIEVDFKTANVVDGNKPVIQMLTESGDSFVGLKINPEEIFMYSQSKRDETTQNLLIDTDVRIRLTLTIMPEAYGNNGFNLCCLYVNGIKNRVFNYESNDYFAHPAPILIGSDYADIDIYALRIYDRALTSEGVQKNYVNLLSTSEEKERETANNDVLDAAGSEVDFFNTVDQYRCFVFDQPFPKKSDPSARMGNLEVFFPEDATKNFTVTNVQCDGQGTSSKLYYEWNMRFRVDKTDSVTTYADGSTDNKLIRLFDRVPKMNRITAKKNWASSMQDHKNGAVNSYNDLFKELGLTNPAIEVEPKVRVAVYQEPFVGFSKSKNEEGEWIYTCMGLFTMGPDKGDKNCFGYDTKQYPDLLAIEGADNSPFPALFRVPWLPTNILYNDEEEAYQYNGANSWDLNAGSVDSISRWIPAYNLVYQCSNRIKPFEGTLAELNADVINYRSTGYEYWIAKEGEADRFTVYYYEASQGKFIPSDIGEGPINLVTQLVGKGYGLYAGDLSGKGNDQLNVLFIQTRIEKFRQEIGEYFDIDSAIFHHNFIEFIAGTDNRAKNTYVYNFGRPGDKWQWRQDDLDTIFPIDNQGQDKKPYYCEVHDFYENGGPVWNGETSNFWNLLELAFEQELTIGARKMLTAMQTLSGQNYGTTYDKVYAFYEKYFISVKKYFPVTLFNSDAKRYENAKLAYIAGSYSNDTDPLTQSHGDFYSAETAWVKKRIIYFMSKYAYGVFSADGTDTITVRAAGDEIIYDLIPAMALYPTIASGTSIIRGERTMPGDICRMIIDLGGAADQQNNIQGASYLLSIGEWYDKNVSGTMIIQGRRLQEIRIGHPTQPITISITGLTISNCPSVRIIDLTRVSTLQGVLDATSCIHLKEIYAGGTNLAQLKLPEGGGLEKVVFSAANNYLSLRNFPY